MFVPVYGATVVLFFVADRYRMPLLVPLCATTGAALSGLFDLARARQFGAVAVAAAALAVLAVPVFADLGLDDGLGGEQTRMAVLLVEQGQFDDARRYVAGIVPRHRHPGVLQFRVGRTLAEAGRDADAIPLFEGALAADGPQPAIRLALGESLARTGAIDAALPHLRAAVERGFDLDVAAPLLIRALLATGRSGEAVQRLPAVPDTAAGEAAAALDFATLALEHGAVAQAVRWGRLAVAATPAQAAAQEALGIALLLAGDPRSAVPPLERARELAPASASIHLNLAAVYAELGRVAEARRMATEARRLDPAEPRAAALLAALPR
jgi:tetratricopeptide (TPR) repeat protein